MTSARKIAANQANGRKSRGPKTAAGKARSSRNALRHGLTIIASENPAYRAEIEALAKALCEGETHPLLYQRALAVAQADVLLCHIRREKVAAIERRKEDVSENELGKTPEAPRQNGAGEGQTGAANHEAAALQRALPDLEVLARYESRAWFRRNKAVTEFIDVMSALAEGILTPAKDILTTAADAPGRQCVATDRHVSPVAQPSGGNRIDD